MIGPAEIEEMMAEYADAVAGSELPEGDPAPVWRAAGEPAAAPAPYRNVGILPPSFLFPFGMRRLTG